jgi:hypothetical protein
MRKSGTCRKSVNIADNPLKTGGILSILEDGVTVTLFSMPSLQYRKCGVFAGVFLGSMFKAKYTKRTITYNLKMLYRYEVSK